MTQEEMKEIIQYSTRGDLLDALEIETDPEIRSLILEELLSR